jgi:trigger factor
MQITVENAGGCKRVIRVEVPADEITRKLAEGYRDLSRQVQFPGFRKGKTPRKVIEKRFGNEIAEEVRQNLANDAVRLASEEHTLKIVGDVEVVENDDLKEGQAARFTLEAEVWPEFELPEYKGLELERTTPTVSDSEVNTVLRNYQIEQGELNPLDRPAAEGDMLRVVLTLTCEGRKLMDQRRGVLAVGTHDIAGLTVDQGAQALVGAGPGKTIELTTTISQDHFNKDLRGKPATLQVEVLDVLAYEGPGLDELAKSRGYESPDVWRDDVRAKLLSERESYLDRSIEEKALDLLASRVEMDLPEKFSKRRAAEMIQQQAFRMYQSGVEEDEIRQYLANSADKGVDEVKDTLKRQFLLDAIARKERLVVTEEEVQREVQLLAGAMSRNADELMEELRAEQRLLGLREELKSRKVLKLLREKAKYV